MSWRHVFDCDKYTTHAVDLGPEDAASKVYQVGYRFMLFKGVVYFVGSRGYGEVFVQDTGLKLEDLR